MTTEPRSGRPGPYWFVYKLIDEAGTIIYVGMTAILQTRLNTHYRADYGLRIVSIETERVAGYDQAAKREAELIRTLAPELNRMGIEPPPDEAESTGTCQACGAPINAKAKVCRPCILARWEDFVTGSVTVADIGRDLGVSRERVRQVYAKHAGASRLPRALRRAVVNERASILADIEVSREVVRAEREGVTCRTCGRGHSRRWNGRWAQCCSPECREMWMLVRYFDPEEYAAHRDRNDSYAVRHPDETPETIRRVAAQRLAGVGPTYEGQWSDRPRRWLTVGSRRWEIACRAYRDSWPAFETWPPEIREQVREAVDAQPENAA